MTVSDACSQPRIQSGGSVYTALSSAILYRTPQDPLQNRLKYQIHISQPKGCIVHCLLQVAAAWWTITSMGYVWYTSSHSIWKHTVTPWCNTLPSVLSIRFSCRIARLFSSNVVLYRTDGYRLRLARCYRLLATGAAACGQWEKALYWLQELINNYVSGHCNYYWWLIK